MYYNIIKIKLLNGRIINLAVIIEISCLTMQEAIWFDLFSKIKNSLLTFVNYSNQ